MILRIAQRELVELRRDGRLLGAGTVLLMLLALALVVGWQRQMDGSAERNAAQQLDYDDWLAQPERHPHDAAHQGLHVFKPVPPLAMLDPGISPYVGSTLWLQAHRQSEVKFRPAQDSTGLQRFGSFSVAWILQVLGPLLVILLGFNTLSAEREQGTLRQLLSLGVPPRKLIAGKAFALGAALTLLLVPLLVCSTIAVAVSAAADERLDTLLRFLVLTLGYVVYLAIFVGLTLAVSAFASSSRVALILLLGAWIAGSILAPRAAADVSRAWFPSESRRDFNARLDAELGEKSQQAWMEFFGADSGTPFGMSVPLSQWGIALQVQDHAGYEVMDRHFTELWESYARQQAMQEWAGVLIPTLAIRAFSMQVAGTDFTQHRAFSVAAETHRRFMQDVISHDLVEHADNRDEQHFSYRAEAELWARIPPFEFRLQSLAVVLPDAARSASLLLLTLLLIWSVVLAAAPRRLK